jgi:hypothetical protein
VGRNVFNLLYNWANMKKSYYVITAFIIWLCVLVLSVYKIAEKFPQLDNNFLFGFIYGYVVTKVFFYTLDKIYE